MIKKILSAIITLVFIISSFGCIVAPAPQHSPPPPRKTRVKVRRPGGSNYFWVKGHWEWRKGRYVWRSGYWKKRRKNRRWIPGHWRKSPSGYVWIKGHWR